MGRPRGNEDDLDLSFDERIEQFVDNDEDLDDFEDDEEDYDWGEE